MQESNYLGTEKVGKLLRQFAIPCIFSLIISCLYNIVDQIFVGNGVGYLGNAATGVIFPITVVGWGLSLFFGDGAAAVLSVSLGRNETQHIHKCVGNSILCSFLAGLVIVVLGYLGGDQLLRLIGATDSNLTLAHDYGFIIYSMIPFALVQNTLASIIRADGSPRYAMGAMLVGAVINIIGDPLAIFVLDMGIKGAAYATILGQFASFLLCACYLSKSKSFRLSMDSFRLDLIELKHVMALGTSSLLTQLSIVVITVINNILLVRYGAGSAYGPDIPLAAFVVIMKLFQIVLNIGIGIAAGAQPIVGYNYGAQRYDRVRELLKLMIKWTAIISLICTVLFEAVPHIFISMFGSDGELYTQFATRCLRIYLSLILFTCVQKVCAIFLQSIGHAKSAAPLSILRDALSKEFISRLNSNENTAMRDLYLSTEAVKQAITAQDLAIKHIADMGACVIIGRAADYVLRSYKNIIRVFIYAPADYRIQNVMKMYGDTREQGRKSIARSDAARSAYYKNISGREWGNPHEYELCIDSSVGVEATANLICCYINRFQ